MTPQMSSTSRLAFVTVPLEGTVKRKKYGFKDITPKGAKVPVHERTETIVEEPAGFMVYFPNGHVLRLSEARCKEFGFDKQAPVANMEGLHNPNSPIGRIMYAQTDKARAEAFRDLQQETIDLATAKSGKELLTKEAA